MNLHPYLSIVIPVHNEEQRIAQTVREIVSKVPARECEIVIIENGSSDQTWFKLVILESSYSNVRVDRIRDRSKALAIMHGMDLARGQWRYMCDADLSTPIDELEKFLRAADMGHDIVIGSRAVLGSTVQTSLKRKLIGRAFNGIIQALTGLEFYDTQCGFKLFSASAARQIFPQVKMRSLAFDVEVLWLAQRMGFDVVEMPVTWTNDPRSVVKLRSDSWQMLQDVLSLPSLHADLKVPQRVTP